MTHSESIANISKALAVFHSIARKISKDSQNPFFKSSYASLPHILQEIAEPLEKSGLVITQWPDQDGLTTMLLHSESGEFFMATYNMPVAKANDPQALGSSITYARRYAVSSVLSLQIDDDDAEAAMKAVRKTASEKPWLNKGEQLDAAIEYLKGGGTIKGIEAKYAINKEVRASLQTVIDNLPK
jgi:hypothetical protein